MTTELSRVDSSDSLTRYDSRNPLEHSLSSIGGNQVNTAALMRRNGGVGGLLNMFQTIIRESLGWVRNADLAAFRVDQVQVEVNQLTVKVSNVAGKYITRIKSALNPADFSDLLKRTQVETIFPGAGVQSNQTYEQKLLEYRKTIKDGKIDSTEKQTADRIFRGLGLGPADRILRPFLPDGLDFPLCSLFKADRAAIREVTPEFGQGWMSSGWTNLLGAVRLFDPIKDGNFPFLIGTRMIGGREVNIFRHPIPTVELLVTIEIAPEYKAFLESLREKEKSVLYANLLHLPGQVSLTSKPRTDLLYDLGKAYPDVFHYIRMPCDGPLTKVDEFGTLEAYRDCVKTELYNAINNPASSSNEFVFGSKKMIDIVDQHYGEIVDFAYNQICNVNPDNIEQEFDQGAVFFLSKKEEKQVFMMLVQTLLRNVLIEELGVDGYNNTCKHASDRAAAATGCDLTLSHLLTGDLKEHSMDLRLTAAWPAFMAKSSAVEEGRAEWLDAFAKFAEVVIALNKREKLVAAYQEAGFPVEGKMSYYRPKLNYPQKGEEIHKSILGQDAKREFSINLPFGPTQPQSELLDNLLNVFEDQYSLSFTRVGEEGLSAESPKREGYNLVTGCFTVCDSLKEAYGELTFSIEFPAEDLESTVLHATIHSELRVVDPLTDGSNE